MMLILEVVLIIHRYCPCGGWCSEYSRFCSFSWFSFAYQGARRYWANCWEDEIPCWKSWCIQSVTEVKLNFTWWKWQFTNWLILMLKHECRTKFLLLLGSFLLSTCQELITSGTIWCPHEKLLMTRSPLIRWKYEGPSDSFKALVDMAAVHSSCRLCIHLATMIREKEEKSPGFKKRPCKCIRGSETVHHLYVRERGAFETQSVFLR